MHALSTIPTGVLFSEEFLITLVFYLCFAIRTGVFLNDVKSGILTLITNMALKISNDVRIRKQSKKQIVNISAMQTHLDVILNSKLVMPLCQKQSTYRLTNISIQLRVWFRHSKCCHDRGKLMTLLIYKQSKQTFGNILKLRIMLYVYPVE